VRVDSFGSSKADEVEDSFRSVVWCQRPSAWQVKPGGKDGVGHAKTMGCHRQRFRLGAMLGMKN